MSVKTAHLTNLAGKLVVDTDADTTSADNATVGTSGSAYIIEIDATAGSPTTDEPGCYVKIVDASSATGGGGSSTVPHVVLYAPLGVITSYVISSGWAFTSGFSFWAVTTAALSGDASPTADIKVSIISS